MRNPFKKTYESITGNLRNLVQDLHDHADAHAEADRARKTANKVAALLD